jgi:chaperonin GroEL (HSP60 family)
VVDELERGLHDALSVVAGTIEGGKISIGGGAAATEIAMSLRDYAASVGGREQLAVESFANTLEIVPKTLAENAGFDQIDLLLKLRKAHKDGQKYAGIDITNGGVIDLYKAKVLEPLRVPAQTIRSSAEAAVMLLRIDDVIAGKGGGAPPAGAGGMPPGGMPPGGY